MEEYQEKMLNKLKEVTEQRKKVFDFITNNPEFETMVEEKQQAMREQWLNLREYEIMIRKKCKEEGLLNN